MHRLRCTDRAIAEADVVINGSCVVFARLDAHDRVSPQSIVRPIAIVANGACQCVSPVNNYRQSMWGACNTHRSLKMESNTHTLHICLTTRHPYSLSMYQVVGKTPIRVSSYLVFKCVEHA